jgi:3-hydroxymyristoyl/3-hydroxydecanoyl-(acyl carrier protein) dehydratase
MQFVVASSHPCLPGHIPGRPLVPGVVILDHVLAAVELGYGPLGPLRLPQVKFVGPLLPDVIATVVLEGAAPRWRFRVQAGDDLLASGEVVAA